MSRLWMRSGQLESPCQGGFFGTIFGPIFGRPESPSEGIFEVIFGHPESSFEGDLRADLRPSRVAVQR